MKIANGLSIMVHIIITSHGNFFSTYTMKILTGFGWEMMVLFNLYYGDFDRIWMGNVGDIISETSAGYWLPLKNMRHIPDIHLNLISTGKLDDEGYVSKFVDEEWKLTKGPLVIVHDSKHETFYKTQAKLFKGEINIIDESSTDL